MSDDEWARVFAAFGPHVPDEEQRARTMRNAELGPYGMELLRRLDVVDQLARINCPTLVCVGALDSVTPIDASREIAGALREGIGKLVVIEGAGHFPWMDAPDEHWRVISEFVADATRDGAARQGEQPGSVP